MHLCDKGIYDEIKQCTLKIENNDGNELLFGDQREYEFGD